MKFKLLLIALVVLSACDKKEKTDGSANSDSTAVADTNRKKCYFFADGKDTVMMTLTQNANNANGELYYSFFEKDKNEGTFSGVFIGDTLYADYTFKSEGSTSIRETVFVRQGNNLVQGWGEMVEKDNRQSFVGRKNIDFGDAMILEEANCAD